MKQFIPLLLLAGFILTAGCSKDDNEDTTPAVPAVVGDYYYSDGSWSTTLNTSKNCVGIVFRAKTETQKGLVVSVKETEKAWSTENIITGANNLHDGAINQKTIQAITGWREKYPAFAWCADLGAGWYLPSKDELQLLYCVYHRIPSQTWDGYPNQVDIDTNAPDIVSRFGAAPLLDKGYWASEEGYNDELPEELQVSIATELACSLNFMEIILNNDNIHVGGSGFGRGADKQNITKVRAVLAF